MFELFGCIDEVIEVVISSKRNKWGKIFGFAKFKEVGDANLLVTKLDNIIIDGKKIHANLLRFNRREAGLRKNDEGSSVRQEQVDVTEKMVQKGRGIHHKVGVRSFVEVVKNYESSSSGGVHLAQDHIKFSSKEEESFRFKKPYVGVVLQLGSIYDIQTHFKMEGYFSIKVTPLGANLCLLEEVEEGEIADLIKLGECWWKQWFSEIKILIQSVMDKERVTWLRIFGIPCQA